MNDQLNDVLAAIDAETAKCICGRAIPDNGPSLDYCSLPCQERFISGLDPITEPVHDVWKGTSDGRAINDEVNAWFRASSNDHPDMGWASAAATLHDEPASPRVEFFPSPRPGDVELAAGIDLTPFITAIEFTSSHSAVIVGDHITITDPEGNATQNVVTSANGDGSFQLEPEGGQQ